MGWDYQLRNAVRYKVKKEMIVKWPCDTQPNRCVKLYPDDILAKKEDGTYIRETGLGIFGIVIDDNDVEQIIVNGTMHIHGG